MRTFLLVATIAALAGAAVPAAGQQVFQQNVQIGSPGDLGTFQMLPPGRQPKTGTSGVRGRIVAGDTGSVLRRAQVRISSPDIGSKTALTDGQGRYEFKDLPAGRFTLSVSKSGFVTMQYGQLRPFEPGHPIELADGQAMDKADIAMPRGSVLSGRILDEFGEAVADANVSAMRMQFVNGRRKLVPAGRNATTNDLGQFRLFGLPPGDYYVSATLRSFDSMIMDMIGAGAAGGPTGSGNNSGYAAAYYPGTASPGEAQRVTVTVGQELTSVDIQLQPIKLARVTGAAFTSDGKPMSGALVMLMPTMREAMQIMPGGTSRTNKDGQFTLSGVAPGDYTIQVQSLAAIMSVASDAMNMFVATKDGPQAQQPSAQQREFATATVSVAGEDLTGLVLAGTRGAHAAGKLVFDGPAPDNLTSLRLMAVPVDDNMPAMASAFGASAVQADGSFTIDGLVGVRLLQLMNAPKGYRLKRVTSEAGDITDRGMEFKPGEDVTGLTIELTTKSTTVTGSVTDGQGQPAKDYTVVAFARDKETWALPDSRWLETARPDQDGRFNISGLPPGDYYAVAVEYVAQGDWADPEWLARAARNATEFSLDEGGAKVLDLKISGS